MSHQIGRFVKFAPFSSLAFLGLFELCAYISGHFHQIQAISFSFSRPIRALGGPSQQAIASAASQRFALRLRSSVSFSVNDRSDQVIGSTQGCVLRYGA